MYQYVRIIERYQMIILDIGLRGLTVWCVVVITTFVDFSAHASDNALEEKLCEVYNSHYEGANKTMASIITEGAFDDSVPRDLSRQIRLLNERVVQLILIQQMQAHGCRIPKSISGGYGYFIDATQCRLQQLQGNSDAVQCDQSKWQSND